MKLKNLLMKALFVAFGLCVGQSVWADTSVVGAVDNSDSKYYEDGEGHSKRYSVANNQKISIEFTVSTATDEQLGGATWNPWYAWAVNFWDGTLNAITVEPRDYGWEASTENNRWTADWAKYWAQNYPSGWDTGTAFRNIIQGATVVTTVERRGTYVFLTYDITTTGGEKYRQYVAKEYGNGTTIWFDLIVHHAHITIDNEKTVTTAAHQVTGTLIGNYNRCTTFTDAVNALRQNFIIAPNSSLSLRFKNYSAGLYTWQSWMFEMLYNGKYCNMVAGNNDQWGELRNGAGTFTNTNWPTDILTQMEGATVDLTITRSGANVVVNAVHTPISGDPFTLNYSFNSVEAGFATSDVEFHLVSDHGYLDLLPVTKAVTAAGWATYCSPYALDLEHATGLTDAYIVTGGENGVLTKTSVKGGTVPANTGLLLKADEGAVTMPIVGASTTDISANKLIGTTETFNLTAETGYVLMATGTNNLGFYKNANAFTVGANTAYLPANFAGGESAREFFSLDDDATAINEAKSQQPMANGLFFDLQGRKVAHPQKGLYIVNGKKVVMK